MATVAVPAVKPEAVPVALVATNAEGVPRAGVTSVGELANTSAPLPVSSLITPASCAEVVAANCDNGLLVRASPPPGKLCHVAAVPLVAISACPVVGAAAAEMFTVVVALAKSVAGPPPPDGVCQVAAEPPVAVRT